MACGLIMGVEGVALVFHGITRQKVKRQGKLNMHIIFESVLMLFTEKYQN